MSDHPTLKATLEKAQEVLSDYEAGWSSNASGHGWLVRMSAALLSTAKDAERLKEALEKIANGDGAYGAQAFEYKEIARAALLGIEP